MAAYAALVSLMNIIDQVQNHPRHFISFNKEQIEFLQQNVRFLQDFLEGYSHESSQEAGDLEIQIASAAHRAEDLIESHVVDQILAESTENDFIFMLDLQEVIQEMDSVKENVMKVEKARQFNDFCGILGRSTWRPSTSSRLPASGKSIMVGFDNYSNQLMDLLTGHQSTPTRIIIPIIGMGGIGKTTLARNTYNHVSIMENFDIRAWVQISQEYTVGKILKQLCSSLELRLGKIDRGTDIDEENLKLKLHKSLWDRRYLVILDDMWSIEVWEKLMFYFPENRNGSRIVVTTRLSNVATTFGNNRLLMDFLDEEKSWKLFCQKVFAKEHCPPEFENIGKKIVEKCEGLPLSITVIGGLLQKSNRSQEFWENVATDINSILNSENEHCSNIMSLSYSHLPAHLKPCFLYMGIFPKNHEIRITQLVKLWVAEGFLKPSREKSLEEVAEDYLKDLVDRNLVLVHSLGWNGKIKSCKIHDLLRDFCLRISEKEKLFCVMRALDEPQDIEKERRIVFYKSLPRVHHALQSASLARSVICGGGHMLFKFKLLRLLNVVESLGTNLQQVNLRYINCKGVRGFFRLPPSISRLWNLQTIVIRGGNQRFNAPSEIWEMRQLRHLEFDDICLPDPPPSVQLHHQDDRDVLLNLQTLLTTVNFKLSEDVCRRIPKIKKLYINYVHFPGTISYYFLCNLDCFLELESLKCLIFGMPDQDDLLLNLTFPNSLKKLSLLHCRFHWEDLTRIGSLPRLEVLKLGLDAVEGTEWNPVEGGFPCLKFLKISCCELNCWNAESNHFPVLQTLFLERLEDLDIIPSDIGYIPTLQVIRLDYCSESAAVSAVEILDEQRGFDKDIQVRVKFHNMADFDLFSEKVDRYTLKSHHFQFSV